MVEAIEDLFIPVLVYNNKSSDSALLKRFNEPSWNNPIVRFLNSDARDVIQRQSGVWNIQPMAARMVAALEAVNRDVPRYLSDLAIDQSGVELATFAMHCYWTGEARLGSIDGVMNTTAGFAGGLEVVQLMYDPEEVDYSTLVKTAQSFECASKVFTHTAAQLETAKKVAGNRAEDFPGGARRANLSEQKYQLRTSRGVRSLPLTTYQSTKINSVIRGPNRNNALEILSPRQKGQLEKIFALLKAGDGTELDEFIFPDDDSELAEYQARLNERLESKE